MIGARLLRGEIETVLRRGVLALAALGLIGAAVELAIERHWGSPGQMLGWVALAAGLAATVQVAARGSRRVRTARALAIAVLMLSTVGVIQHVQENLKAGPLDADYSVRWETMSRPARLWAAASKAVGPAPTLAPGALAEAGLAVLLATVRIDRRSGEQ